MTMQTFLILCVAAVATAGCDDSGTKPPSPDMGSLEQRRASCEFQKGSLAKDTIDLSAIGCPNPIKHVIIVMKENRSFDHLFGELSKHGQPDAEPRPASFSNLDLTGAVVAPTHATTTCIPFDPHHQWDDMHAQVNGGKMDGFVKNAAVHVDDINGQATTGDGHFVMGYYDNTDLPFYYWVASTFALADRYFPSVQSGTWSNRDFLMAATSNGIKNTAEDPKLSGVPLIMDSLEAKGITWDLYTNSFLPTEGAIDWGNRRQDDLPTFFSQLADGTIPQVSFVEAELNTLDEHPPADVQKGEAWSHDLFQSLFQSPVWPSTVVFYTYDEAGGFADHVPPPSSCAPSPDQATFTELGVRVSMVAVSPYAKRHFVSHQVHEHTSILRFIELLFNVPALTARDANSDAMLDMFDFCGTPNTDVGAIPAAGTNGCMPIK
jgi:phospholipase C